MIGASIVLKGDCAKEFGLTKAQYEATTKAQYEATTWPIAGGPKTGTLKDVIGVFVQELGGSNNIYSVTFVVTHLCYTITLIPILININLI